MSTCLYTGSVNSTLAIRQTITNKFRITTAKVNTNKYCIIKVLQKYTYLNKR